MSTAGQAYTHDGITITFGEEGLVASDTTVTRNGVTVYATTDHLLAPRVVDLFTAVATHAAALIAAGREVLTIEAFTERIGADTVHHQRVTYTGDPVHLPTGVISFD